MTTPAAAGPGGIRGRLLVAVAALLCRLPEGPLVAAAAAIGELYYHLAPTRAAQVRANLRRVCDGLAAQHRGTALARRAATDPDALELLVRRAFRHLVRYYLEVARVGALRTEDALTRIDLEDEPAVRAAIGPGAPVVVVGMHFGAIELPVVLFSHLVGHPVMAPMELVADPVLREWFLSSRRRVGINAVPITNARRTLLKALRGGESVGMAVDRDIMGNGLPVPFFGHLAPIPAGPALLAVEAGVPVYVGSVRRTRNLRYAARVVLVPTPETGTRRERMMAVTSGIVAEFERVLADGPEQWWGSFHPIWPDLAVGDHGVAAAAADAEPGHAAEATGGGDAPGVPT
jgi:lauroyl/myristoyl acyltransferase